MIGAARDGPGTAMKHAKASARHRKGLAHLCKKGLGQALNFITMSAQRRQIHSEAQAELEKSRPLRLGALAKFTCAGDGLNRGADAPAAAHGAVNQFHVRRRSFVAQKLPTFRELLPSLRAQFEGNRPHR